MNKIFAAIIISPLLFGAFAQQEEDASQTLAVIENATGWTASELANGLEMLNRIYEADCKTAQGRVKWNGPVVNVKIDTNTLTKTTTYTNGFVYTERFTSRVPTSLKDRLTSAEVIAAQKKREAEKISDRLVYLESDAGFSAEVENQMRKNSYPRDLAEAVVKNEISILKSKAEVFGIVTPQK